jgi:hypothetical protein
MTDQWPLEVKRCLAMSPNSALIQQGREALTGEGSPLNLTHSDCPLRGVVHHSAEPLTSAFRSSREKVRESAPQKVSEVWPDEPPNRRARRRVRGVSRTRERVNAARRKPPARLRCVECGGEFEGRKGKLIRLVDAGRSASWFLWASWRCFDCRRWRYGATGGTNAPGHWAGAFRARKCPKGS